MTAKRHIAGAVALALGLISAASAQAGDTQAPDCRLDRVSSLPISTLADGDLSVPVRIGDQREQLLLAIGEPHTIVTSKIADRLHLKVRMLPDGMMISTLRQYVYGRAALPSVQIGTRRGTNFPALFVQKPPDPGIAGELGLDLLTNFDVELNLASHRLNLYLHNHCDGNVIYWGRPPTVLPFKFNLIGQPVFKMRLDGKKLSVIFRTLDGPNAMGTAEALDTFGITPKTPGIRALPAPEARLGYGIKLSANFPDLSDENRMEMAKALEAFNIPPSANFLPAPPAPKVKSDYRYPFKLLALNGLKIRNPDIVLFPQTQVARCIGRNSTGFMLCYGSAQLSIGRNQMRGMRLYFAFKDRKLYITSADASPSSLPARHASVAGG